MLSEITNHDRGMLVGNLCYILLFLVTSGGIFCNASCEIGNIVTVKFEVILTVHRR